MRITAPTTEASVAARDEYRLRELDRKSAATAGAIGALGVRARHSFTGTRTISTGGAFEQLTAWTTDRSDGIAIHEGGGVFSLRRAGTWSAKLIGYSNGVPAGNIAIALRSTVLFDHLGELRSGGYTGPGGSFSGAGYDDRSVDWVGPVSTDEADVDLTAWARWWSADAATGRAVTYRLVLNLLSGDTS